MTLLPFEKRKSTLLRVGTHEETLQARPALSIDELTQRGVICVNKPKGPTSHQVSEYIQRIMKIDKAGHGGTLDPPATGVLPVALGKSTRVVQALLPAGKEYVCLMHLHTDCSAQAIERACRDMVGTITQLPPVKSAVKREERDRKIYYMEVLEIAEREVLFRVGCEAGTYIRRLCEQIGERLGTKAHMQQLVRTKAGPFRYDAAVTLEELEDAIGDLADGDESAFRNMVLPVEFAVTHLPKIYAFDGVLPSVQHGVDVKIPGIAFVDSDLKRGELVALLNMRQELIALGEAALDAATICNQQKGIAFVTKRVFT